MSSFFIRRPIFSAVISIVIVIAGLVASRGLPIAQYPEIAPPSIFISASYPGASADTVSKTVAAPIEDQLNGIPGLLYYSSSSASSGTLNINATFEAGTDAEIAAVNVNNRVKLAEPHLPEEVRRNGVVVQKRSPDILMINIFFSEDKRYDSLFLSNYISLNVLEEVKRLHGVGDAVILGAKDYSMRVWLRPDRMAQLGVTTSDIATAIRTQNSQNAAGKIGQEPVSKDQMLVYTVTARGRLSSPEEFGNIVIRADGPGGMLRLRDVARVELGSASYVYDVAFHGKPVVGMAVYLQSGANALEVAKAVRGKLRELSRQFPEGVDYDIPSDSTLFISESIHEVVLTLLESALLVVGVVFLFLQNWRATLIPMVAVPVSLIGTFAGLWLFGFSINTLTLFAMVLAIGIVVDDAIVVLENVERLMSEEKLSPYAAAVESMREVSGAVVAIVLVLCAVFIPVAFLGGISGKLYQQFAVTVAVSVVISGIVALTLTPALCALLLKPIHEEAPLFRPFNRAFNRFTNFYTTTVGRILAHGRLALLLFVGVLVVVAALLKIVPGGFVPSEDMGRLVAAIRLPDGASLQRTAEAGERLRNMVAANPGVEYTGVIRGVDLIGGANQSNNATMIIELKPWSQRSQSAQELTGLFMGYGMTLPDGIGLTFNPPPIMGLGSAGGFEAYLQNRADADPAKLSEVLEQFVQALRARPELAQINTFFRANVPQLHVEVDEAKALAMGIPVPAIYETLQSTMGELYVNDFNRVGKVYKVQLQAESHYRSRPEDLTKVYVRSATTQTMIPLGAVIKVRRIVGPEQLERYNGFLAAKIMGGAAPGLSSGTAISVVEEVARETLPEGYTLAWTGQALQEKYSGGSSVQAFVFAIVMVFLILAAQYEKWSLPLAVIMAVPFALVGALLAILMRGMANDIYFQIGLVVLIGLAAKNAILIVEFAAQKRAEGMDTVAAALEAARLRFRPIIMTSLAFILGVLPLAISSGAGAAARRSMGTGVVGGMLVATFVAILFVPLFFKWLERGKQVIPAGHAHATDSGDEA
ncbi:efflux RND transporter permease subunit [Denitratisoma oestradiolicum]|uniref:Efflux pump membrane transporter n=1 Tax=Denitratisoma oestradiolicum TaxID=311182 RepID=A0A6S6XXY8_9PROT|nr:multidrug efflux RND transporter permease subunit [Denitratisoma oestradiolicum]TWO80785.1 hydrophobe/amphiphile efflux-1 family RND transporter [Denitratisoma oestradiolicum]CAB1370899.1 multidrug efflux system protein [Denitratisoma oestradiolicum]